MKGDSINNKTPVKRTLYAAADNQYLHIQAIFRMLVAHDVHTCACSSKGLEKLCESFRCSTVPCVVR